MGSFSYSDITFLKEYLKGMDTPIRVPFDVEKVQIKSHVPKPYIVVIERDKSGRVELWFDFEVGYIDSSGTLEKITIEPALLAKGIVKA